MDAGVVVDKFFAAGAVDSYIAGKDTVIEITGLVDLSTASFNVTYGTLEIA